jgi:hypothetical protein
MVLLESWMKIIGGILGIILEGGDMVYHEAYTSESHWDHLRILTLITLVGIVDLLHIFSFLKENFWCVVTPVGFALIAFMFNLHQQDSAASTFAHNINAYLLYAGAISRFVELMIGIHSNPQHHKMALTKIRNIKERSPTLENKPTHSNNGGSSTCFSFWPFSVSSKSRKHSSGSGSRKGKQYPLNPIYTNPFTYKTIFPMLTAILIIMEGMWWWYMGVTFFWPGKEHGNMVMMGHKMVPQKTSAREDHHHVMAVVGAFYKVVLSSFGGAILLNLLLHLMDRWICFPKRDYKGPVDENGASYYQEETDDDDDHLENTHSSNDNQSPDLEMQESPKTRLLRSTS